MHNKIKIFSIFLALTISVCFLSIFNHSDAHADSSIDYYCRSALENVENGEALVYAYDKIVNCVENSLEQISIVTGSYTVTKEEFSMVFDAYRRDHPEHYWLDNNYSYMLQDNTYVVSFLPNYLTFTNEQKQLFEDKVEEFLVGIDLNASQFDIELAIHDRVASKVSYVEGSNAHNAYGAIVEGKAVCEGYAEAFQLLLQKVGIQSYIALGSSLNPSTGKSENHAWNVVRIDGKYYHVDLTWNDQDNYVFHAYFNVTDEMIQVDHNVRDSVFELPVCNSLEKNYFTVKGGKLSSYSVQEIADLLKSNGLVLSVFIEGSVSTFTAWFNENVPYIAQKIGISGSYAYSYFNIGKEVVLLIDACLHKNRTRIDPVTATCKKNGNVEYYVCECGRWFGSNDGEDEILDRNSVVTTGWHNFTSKTQSDKYVANIAEDCRDNNTYYYACIDCGKVGTETYVGDQTGEHKYSDKYSYDTTGHWKGCIYCSHVSDVQSHQPDIPAPTEDQAQLCETCGYVIQVELSHVHSPIKHDEKEATCEEDGNYVYYDCKCGKWFTDELATQEITDKNTIIIKALGHEFTVMTVDEDRLFSKAENCISFDKYKLECDRCGELSNTLSFDSANRGPHKAGAGYEYDETNHCEKCIYCSNPILENKEPHNIDIVFNKKTSDGYFKVEGCSKCSYQTETSLPDFEEVLSIENEAVQITVPSDSNAVLEKGTIINVVSVSEVDERVTQGLSEQSPNKRVLGAFELYLTHDGQNVFLNDTVTVTVSNQSKLPIKKVAVLMLSKDGEYVKQYAQVYEDGTVSFDFVEGGLYIILDETLIFEYIPLDKIAIIAGVLLVIVILISVVAKNVQKRKIKIKD